MRTVNNTAPTTVQKSECNFHVRIHYTKVPKAPISCIHMPFSVYCPSFASCTSTSRVSRVSASESRAAAPARSLSAQRRSTSVCSGSASIASDARRPAPATHGGHGGAQPSVRRRTRRAFMGGLVGIGSRGSHREDVVRCQYETRLCEDSWRGRCPRRTRTGAMSRLHDFLAGL